MISRVKIMELKTYCEMIRRDGLKDENDLIRITARAKCGEPEMQALLGDLIVSNRIPDRDKKEGISWLLKAAEGRSADAMYSLSHIFSADDELDPDKSQTIKWLDKAAKAGCTEAQIEYGMHFYRNGADIDLMDWWFTSALNNGDPRGVEFLGQYLVDNNPPGSPDYRYGLQKLASAVDGGSIEAAKTLFRIHCEHNNRSGAIRILKKAVDLEDPESMYILGCLYLKGIPGIRKDNAKAFRMLSKAMDSGCTEAAWRLGYLYLHGIGTEKDHDYGVQLLTEGMNHNDAESIRHLGEMYLNGIGVPVDSPKAEELFRRAKIAESTGHADIMPTVFTDWEKLDENAKKKEHFLAWFFADEEEEMLATV